jgi:hypothetical protein
VPRARDRESLDRFGLHLLCATTESVTDDDNEELIMPDVSVPNLSGKRPW